MEKTNVFVDSVNKIVTEGVNKGILHLYTNDEALQGNQITLNQKPVINFGSCSYLGLEFDKRLQDAAIKAIQAYGTQFSASRAYVSVGYYAELEALCKQIFDAYCVIVPTTTLGHIATIPVVVNENDAVIIDHQVHSSVQTAIMLLKAKGVHTELLRHNNMIQLEERINALKDSYDKIWYFADGIYSMYGDKCPADEIYKLLDKYRNFHFYVDDAHGMSVYGKNGRGYILSNRHFHEKMILTASFAKGFATGGAVVVFPTEQQAKLIRTCGLPLITSGPMQPAQLNAAIASAKIHLSSEIIHIQNDLYDKIEYAKLLLRKFELPIISNSDTSVFFLGVSLPKIGYTLVKKMLDKGYYLNLGIFPAVPLKRTGVRFTITKLHSLKQIESMIYTLANEFYETLKEDAIDIKTIYKAFKLDHPDEIKLNNQIKQVIHQTISLKAEYFSSIQQINQTEWDSIFQSKGNFDYQGLIQLENSFKLNNQKEDNWNFEYIIVRDRENKIVLATFLTTAIWKDDMLAPEFVSKQIEELRKDNKYYLTSKVISTGSLLTEGEHIYLNKISAFWKEAFLILIERIDYLVELHNADRVVLRDLHEEDKELEQFMIEQGYLRFEMPDNHFLSLHQINNSEDYYQSLSHNGKKTFRKDVRKYEKYFNVEILKKDSEKDLDYYYNLYLNVKRNSLSLNTFNLPYKVFESFLESKNWEVMLLNLSDQTQENKRTVAVVFAYKSGSSYVPMIIGMDYTYNKVYNVYKQALYQVVKRAQSCNANKVHFGFSSSITKKMFGAKVVPTYGYMQDKDHYNVQVISNFVAVETKVLARA